MEHSVVKGSTAGPRTNWFRIGWMPAAQVAGWFKNRQAIRSHGSSNTGNTPRRQGKQVGMAGRTDPLRARQCRTGRHRLRTRCPHLKIRLVFVFDDIASVPSGRTAFNGHHRPNQTPRHVRGTSTPRGTCCLVVAGLRSHGVFTCKAKCLKKRGMKKTRRTRARWASAFRNTKSHLLHAPCGVFAQ